MALYSLENIVNIARTQSEFYKNLYKDTADQWCLDELPIINSKEFWRANDFNNNKLITSRLEDGIILTSGGSTGDPKFSVYSKDEWSTQSKVLGYLLKKTGLIKSRDRVANLVSVGRLYGAFLLIHDALMNSLSDCLELPISREASIEYTANIIQRFNANVLIGFPLTLVNLASYVRQHNIKLNVERIIYGGETMYSEQLSYIRKAFPNARVSTCVYSSSDGGLMGYCDEDCTDNEHRVEDTCAILEILDNNGNLIHKPFQEGMLHVTSLMKNLMPVIRYPVGDKAMWLEEQNTKNRKFKLLGRSENLSINLQGEEIDIFSLSECIAIFNNQIEIIGYQLTIDNKLGIDRCTLSIACEHPEEYISLGLESSIRQDFLNKFQFLESLIQEKRVLINIEFIHIANIKPNPGSGKHKKILDIRN